MTDEQQIVWTIKGIISELGPEDKQKVDRALQELRDWQMRWKDTATLVLALAGAEIAAKDD